MRNQSNGVFCVCCDLLLDRHKVLQSSAQCDRRRIVSRTSPYQSDRMGLGGWDCLIFDINLNCHDSAWNISSRAQYKIKWLMNIRNRVYCLCAHAYAATENDLSPGNSECPPMRLLQMADVIFTPAICCRRESTIAAEQ